MKICNRHECNNLVKSNDRRILFCSRQCAALHNHTLGKIKRKSTKKVDAVCKWCNNKFTYLNCRSNGVYCSNECNGLAKSFSHKQKWLNEDANTLKNITRDSIRKYLIEECGNKCSIIECNVHGTWLNKDIVLIVDHINGDASDNRFCNVRLICPNCSSQTDTFSGRNRGNGRKSRNIKLN